MVGSGHEPNRPPYVEEAEDPWRHKIRLTNVDSGEEEEITREDLLGRVFAEQVATHAQVRDAVSGLEAVYARQDHLAEEVRRLDRKTMWGVVALSVLGGGGLIYAGKKASAAEEMSFRAAKSARGVRRAISDLDNKVDKTNARMDAMNDKVSYGFKTVLGVGEPKH